MTGRTDSEEMLGHSGVAWAHYISGFEDLSTKPENGRVRGGSCKSPVRVLIQPSITWASP